MYKNSADAVETTKGKSSISQKAKLLEASISKLKIENRDLKENIEGEESRIALFISQIDDLLDQNAPEGMGLEDLGSGRNRQKENIEGGGSTGGSMRGGNNNMWLIIIYNERPESKQLILTSQNQFPKMFKAKPTMDINQQIADLAPHKVRLTFTDIYTDYKMFKD